MYTPEGELVLHCPQQWSSMEWKGTGLPQRESGISRTAKVFYQLRYFPACRRPPKRRYHFSHQILTWAPMASDGSGEYTLPIPGSPPYEPGGSLWETVADGTLNSLSLQAPISGSCLRETRMIFMSGCPRMTRKSWKHYTYDPSDT